MKTAFKFLMTLAICMFTLWSCSDDEASVTLVEGEGQVTFSFDVINDTNTPTNGNKSFRNSQLVKTTPNQIVVTIQSTDDGSIVYDKEKLDVIAFNDNFISDPIALKTGNYELIEYFVLDEDENTLYVAPLEGSTLAYLVNDPLGTNFSIAKDDSKQITPEVITPEGFTADDFGYTDFSFDIVETIDFLISVHAFDVASESYELTDATILVTADGTEVYNKAIANVTEQIRVRDGYNSYTITITKSGYDDDMQTFTANELKSYENAPLVIQLTESLLKVGALAEGGIVYQIFQLGDEGYVAGEIHGMVASPTLGKSNWPGAQSLINTLNQGEFSNWILPSYGNLGQIRTNLLNVGADLNFFDFDYHWAANIISGANWGFNPKEGSGPSLPASFNASVLGIREF
ncbi:hypothetical protein [Tenacibaculum agarivorans]|uniref:hypothetical protein n=1 Tax=Tenacibaculum agarivorans TaxID=1908389 RepID=UPI000AC5D32D|nr:hypothetical protein [Tenacibaculum agarivorans]